VLRPHGVRGDLFLQVLTDYPERVGTLGVVYLAGDVSGSDAVGYTVEGVRRHRGGLILRLEGARDRTQAEALRQAWVLVALEDAIPLEDGEFYLFQLIGLEVVTTSGEVLGVLREVIETGANDVYVVRGGGRGEVLIPAVPHVVRGVDLDAGRVMVELPEGMFA
jgi:16S rRNA processing protein RimM